MKLLHRHPQASELYRELRRIFGKDVVYVLVFGVPEDGRMVMASNQPEDSLAGTLREAARRCEVFGAEPEPEPGQSPTDPEKTE
jgi:hypothetical protein